MELKIVVFGSMGKKKIEFVAIICQAIIRNKSDVLFVIAPRNPVEPYLETIVTICNEKGMPWHKMSQGCDRKPTLDILIYNGFGKLPSIYAISDIILIGDSFIRDGEIGHNFMEGYALGKPVVFGEAMNATQPYADMAIERGTPIKISRTKKLIYTLPELLQNEVYRGKMGRQGKQFYD